MVKVTYAIEVCGRNKTTKYTAELDDEEAKQIHRELRSNEAIASYSMHKIEVLWMAELQAAIKDDHL